MKRNLLACLTIGFCIAVAPYRTDGKPPKETVTYCATTFQETNFYTPVVETVACENVPEITSDVFVAPNVLGIVQNSQALAVGGGDKYKRVKLPISYILLNKRNVSARNYHLHIDPGLRGC